MRNGLIITILLGLLLPFYAANASNEPLIDLKSEAKKYGEVVEEKQVAEPTRSQPKPAEKQEPAHQQAAAKTETATKPHSTPEHPPHWTYSGETGPRHWGELSDQSSLCQTGKNQSPINLKMQQAVGTTSLPGFDVYYRETALKMVNNGHTLQVNIPLGSYIEIDGRRFELLQYHFHTPSEHQRDGFNYPMEMHLVHKDADGNLAVIGVLLQEGEENEALAQMLPVLPQVKDKVDIHEWIKIHPAAFFPADKKFYKYSGSLTTPPCSEGVYWMVFKNPIQASVMQLKQLHDYLGSNARPVNPHYARSLLKSWQDIPLQNRVYEFY